MPQRRHIRRRRTLAQHLHNRVARHQVDQQKHHRHHHPKHRQRRQRALTRSCLRPHALAVCLILLVVSTVIRSSPPLTALRRRSPARFNSSTRTCADPFAVHLHHRKPPMPSISTVSPGVRNMPQLRAAADLPASPRRPRAAASSAVASPGRADSRSHPAAARHPQPAAEALLPVSNSSSNSPTICSSTSSAVTNPDRRPKLIHHDRNLPPPLLKLLQQIHDQLRLREPPARRASPAAA